MLAEFQRTTFISRLIHFARKIVTSDFIPFHPEKKWWDDLINGRGWETRILEVGSGYRRLDKKVINMDIMIFPNVDVVGDGHNLPFKDGSFDTVWMETVLEHVRKPIDVVTEARRVLKEGGYIYAVVPFNHPYHGYPHDYWRYSQQGLGELFAQFREVESGVYRGPSVALVNFLSDYFSLSANWRMYLLTKALCLCLIFPLKYLDLLWMKNAEAHRLAHCLYYIGVKGEE
jgi:SAM-dependent methyltransferase